MGHSNEETEKFGAISELWRFMSQHKRKSTLTQENAVQKSNGKKALGDEKCGSKEL